MQSLPTLPQRTWLERVSLTLTGALGVVAAASLMGWWLDISQLLQPFTAHPAIKINAALAFLILGLVLLAIEFGSRKAALFGLLPAAIGALTLFQDAFRADLG